MDQAWMGEARVMKVDQTTKEEWETRIFSDRMFLKADIAIVDGVMVKNRHGKPGAKVDGVLVVWDEKEVG